MARNLFSQSVSAQPAFSAATAEKQITSKLISWETESLLYLCPSVYGLLSRLYQGPLDKAFLKGLKESHIFTLRFPVYGWPELKDGLEAMLRQLDYPGEELGLLAKELKAEYRLLFSCCPQAQAPPVESFFLSPTRPGQQTIGLEVRERYLQAGIVTNGNGGRPEDHLCAELEFMASLSQQMANALELDHLELLKHWLLLQQTFLLEHLLKWVPQFARQVQRAAKTGFYQALARFTHAFLCFHLALLQGLSVEPGQARST